MLFPRSYHRVRTTSSSEDSPTIHRVDTENRGADPAPATVHEEHPAPGCTARSGQRWRTRPARDAVPAGRGYRGPARRTHTTPTTPTARCGRRGRSHTIRNERRWGEGVIADAAQPLREVVEVAAAHAERVDAEGCSRPSRWRRCAAVVCRSGPADVGGLGAGPMEFTRHGERARRRLGRPR
ncbi:hypothetical protein FXW78_25985 [Rhodococcus opacus]|nr:hypothetical protein [Rhodococcus opacus]